LDFFHSLAGLGCGEASGDDSGADPFASPWDLFFPTLVFEPLVVDAFILQVQGVFTRIRSGAMLVVDGGGALGFPLSRAAEMIAKAVKGSLSNRSIRAAAIEENEKP
jgi:hypothetical protein